MGLNEDDIRAKRDIWIQQTMISKQTYEVTRNGGKGAEPGGQPFGCRRERPNWRPTHQEEEQKKEMQN